MFLKNIKTRVGFAKIALFVLGCVAMGIGLHSHFQSTWKKNDHYKVCTNSTGAVPEGESCPSISMENFYVAMIIMTFVLLIGILVATVVLDKNNSMLKWVDIIYHVVAALLLLIAAIFYLVSAEQINDLTHCYRNDLTEPEANFCKQFLRSEKLAAGTLTLIQSVLYAATAILVFQSKQHNCVFHSN